jgi:phosphoribosylaminoimidazole-succinocarboxamide synthase
MEESMSYQGISMEGKAQEPFLDSSLPLPGKCAGKVRDSYTLEGGRRLIVTTDRLSAFDRVLAAMPWKGQILNELSAFWFEETRDIIPNHVVSVPDPNALVAIEARPLPIEVIVRGYMTGVTSTALWHRYSLGERSIYGYGFPEGLRKNSALPEPIITPTTKGGPTGHDERLTRAEVVEKGYLDAGTWKAVEDAALAIFERGRKKAAAAGLLLVDTKYEFGLDPDGRLILIDEVHTPDSSRFWEAESCARRLARGLEPESFDKEFLRLAFAELGYRGDGPAPGLPPRLLEELGARYVAVHEKLRGKPFVPGAYPVEGRLERNLREAGILA